MKQSIVMSVLGDDTSGLVESLSSIIVQHQGEWVESKMAHLSGKFAGILRINLPPEKVAEFTKNIQQAQLGLQISLEQVKLQKTTIKTSLYSLDLIGQDQVGIVNKLSSALSKINVNVEELCTEIVDASMSGEHLFKAKAVLAVPVATDIEHLEDELNKIADELILDLVIEKM